MKPSGAPDGEWVYSVCDMCYGCCGIRVHRRDGAVVRIEGNPDYPHNWGRLCAKGNAGLMGLYNPGRASSPLKRTNLAKGIGVDPQWVEISWEEALDTIAQRLQKVRQEDPRKLMVAVSIDLSLRFWAMLWAQAFGTPNSEWTSAGMFCGAGLHMFTYMTNATFHSEVDLSHCNYCILIGNQLGFGIGISPNLLTQKMADARARGMKVVVVDPVCSTAASKANEWVPIRPGTDAALALSMVNVLVNELGIYDADFIKGHTNGPYLVGPDGRYVRDGASGKPMVWDGADRMAKPYDSPSVRDASIEGTYEAAGAVCQPAFQRLKDHVRSYTPESVSQITTVPAETIRRIAAEFGRVAQIGSTICIEGQELPYRPVAVNQYRGATSHKHGGMAALAIQMLNLVVGAVYSAGGHQGANPIGPWWTTQEGPDGLLVAAPAVQSGPNPYRFMTMEARPPQSTELPELFPASWSHCSAVLLSLLEPERYGLNRPEVMLHGGLNLMMTTVDPQITGRALAAIPFMVSFAREIDETVEFADIVLPEPHYLERFDPVTTSHRLGIAPASGYWYWGVRQAAIEPDTDVRNSTDVLIELANRVGFLADFNQLVGGALSFRQPCPDASGEPDKVYSREELGELWVKALGTDHDLAWFKEHGCLKWERSNEESYPFPSIKQRIPIYYEHLLSAGDYVRKVRGAMGFSSDISGYDYQPLPDWKPCDAFSAQSSEYDLFCVNYTLPFHTYSFTAENPWLNEVAEHHPYAYRVLLNPETAKRRSIKDGDAIRVTTITGRSATGKARVTECVHPEVVAIAGVFGSWARGKPIARGKGTHFNSLLPFDLQHVDMMSLSTDACERVTVRPL
ncbi:MAG: molybdopterin-dependent oxidoreductase [Chloroflexi bacterium]|nr:molybdopterin-dependent oxidoreductase [Chloroflexota bacterium]